MIKINFKNLEELIFYDENTHNFFPDLIYHIEQWKLSKRLPVLKKLGQQACYDFLNSINKEHIKQLSNYFQDEVTIDNVNYGIITNHSIELKSELNINDLNLYPNLVLFRDKDKLYLTSWR